MRKELLPEKNSKGKRSLIFDIVANHESRYFCRVPNLSKSLQGNKKNKINFSIGNFFQKLFYKIIKDFSFKQKAVLILTVLFYSLVAVGLTVLFRQSIVASEGKTAKVNFYASEFFVEENIEDGQGWFESDKALGEENVGRSGDVDLFNYENSAIYQGGKESLILSGFITSEYIKISDNENIVGAEENSEEIISTSSENIEDNNFELPIASSSEENILPEEVNNENEAESSSENNIVEEENINLEEVLDEELIGEEIINSGNESDNSVNEEPVENFEENIEAQSFNNEPVSMFKPLKDVLALGGKKVKEYFSSQMALAQWGSEADDRNLIFGEFKSAKIKFSLAVLEKIIDNNPLDEIIEESSSSQEDIILDNENIEDMPEGDTQEDDVEFENKETVNFEEETEESMVEEEAKNEESGFLEKILNLFSPKEAGAEEGDSKITIWYSFANKDFEGQWIEFSDINYSYFSNFTNNGYLSVEAPFLNDWKDIDDLRLKFEGKVNGKDFVFYLDSAWVEVEYKTEKDSEETDESISKNKLEIDGKEIILEYTDGNENENLIIRSNEKDYVGLTKTEVYFSVENVGKRDEEININFYFPENIGEVLDIEKLYLNKPYLSMVPKYKAEVYSCDNGWDKRDDYYLCYPTNETKICNSVSPNRRYCRVEDEEAGVEKEIKYKDEWEKMKLADKIFTDEKSFFKRILGLGPQNKEVPQEFKAKKSTDEEGIVLAPGELAYFKATLNFPVNSSGEFYIETIGHADGYGLLDPWWNSGWNYRLPITINNSGNQNALSDYQVYVEIPTTSVSFWQNVKSNGGDVRFVNSSEDTELDFWMQYFDSSASSAAFWVQVDSIPAATTTDIYIYYGNGTATTTSNAYNPFSYSSMQDVFYVVSSSSQASVKVVSLIDNNEVQLDDQTSVSLNRQEMTTFTNATSTSILKTKGPVYAKVAGSANASALAPISFVGTNFIIPSSRGVENFYSYAISLATTTIYDGSTQEQQQLVSQGSVWETSTDITSGNAGRVESSNPILLAFNNNTPADGLAVYPATFENLYGVRSQDNFISVATSGVSFSIYCSNQSSVDVSSVDQGQIYSNTTCTGGSEGTGDAVRIAKAIGKIGAIQQDDSDGDSSTMFLPFSEFSSEYMVPTNAAYLAAVCSPKAGNMILSVYDENDSFVASTTCSTTNEYPGKAYFGGDGDTTSYNAGSRIVSDNNNPFYAYYEDNTATGTAVGGDETNLWGPVQSRKSSWPNPSYSLGAQEILGAPTGSFNSVSQKQDGSGGIDISIEVDDISNDDCRAKIEYIASSSCDFSSPLDPTLSETSTSISADFGTVIIENDNPYQIGTTSGWISTFFGSNTVQFDWLSRIDLPSADGVYCLRLTANDTLEDQDASATTTITIDNVAPSQPGSLSLARRTGTSITLNFGATSTDSNFKEYKIFYKVYDGFPVTESGLPHSSSSDINLATSTFNGAASTTISGLSAGIKYTFNIWAYDQYGNKASSSQGVDITANDAPTGSFNTSFTSLKKNGSGRADISIEVDDLNNSNEVRAKIEYVAGSSCDFSSPIDPTIDETPANISADFGTVIAENDNPYQVGTTSGWILTAPGSNTVQFDWLTKIDLLNATGTYCLRLTVNDGLDDQAIPATTTLYIDNKAPTAPGNLTGSDVTFNTVKLLFATTTPSADDNPPTADAYKIFYKAGSSGVTESDARHIDDDLNYYNYNNTSSTTAASLSVGTQYVFNIWAYDEYGNSASSTEIVASTDSYLSNKSLVFVNPQSSGTSTDIAVADGSSQHIFRAVVNNADGWGTIDEVVLRLANANDSSSPYDDLKFKWEESSNNFSEIGTDANSMASVSASSSSVCDSNSCTLDFKIIFNKSFAATSTDYSAEIYSLDDLSRTDSDSYADIFQVRRTWLDQIHYRWRNDDGGG